jgi:hypothetical protein
VTTIDTRLADLVSAASALAYSREQDMDTCEEWDDLNRALLAAEEAPPTDASPRYEFKGDTLMRYSTLASGAAEDHACDVDDIEQVAYAIEDKRRAKWFVVDEVATGSHRAWITAYIAIEFLKRCGLVRDDGTANRLRAARQIDGFSAEQAIAEFAVGQIKAREGSPSTGRA